MYCTKCGSELPEGVRHCYVCGAAVRQLPPLRTGQGFPASQNTPASPAPGSGYTAGTTQPAPGPAYTANQIRGAQPGSSYPPPPPVSPAYQSGTTYAAYHHNPAADSPDTVGMFEWLWSIFVVLLLPGINFILLAVWAFGAGAKPSKRNWARAMLIFEVVCILLWIAGSALIVELLGEFPY